MTHLAPRLALAVAIVLTLSTPRAQDTAPPSAAQPPVTAPSGATPIRPARLQGSVKLERNRPVVGAAVTVVPEASDGEVIVTTTDSRGTFRVDDVPDGAYT